jgi:16S rRNA (uracil1498-N3)-methyltransferase
VTPRLLASGPLAAGASRELSAEQAHHVLRVLRLRPGDALELFDGRGARHAATIESVDGKRCTVRIGIALPGPVESPLRLTLAQCLSSAERMDWTIEKAVELGVDAIAPLQSERSVVRLDAARAQRRAEHWARLVESACAQCGRDRLPSLEPLATLPAWLDATRDDPSLRLVLSPGSDTPLSTIEPPAAPAPGARLAITILVGPESGLSPTEVAAARAAGFVPVFLGPRVLRTETAGLAAAAVLQSRFGDL